MAMDETDKIVVLIVILIVFSIALYIEFKYIRGRGARRRAANREATLKKDRAFNTLHTARAIRNKLRSQGFDTTKAGYMIDKANESLDVRDYESCLKLSEKAKQELMRCQQQGTMAPEEESSGLDLEIDETDRISKMTQDQTAKAAVKTGGGLYLQSKFELNAAKDELLSFEGTGDLKEKVKKLIDESAKLFEKGEYQGSLSCSFKARKILSGEEVSTEVEETDIKEVEADTNSCPNCGSEIDPDDQFCGSCGGSLNEKKCNSCGAVLQPKDTFCRKCGSKN